MARYILSWHFMVMLVVGTPVPSLALTFQHLPSRLYGGNGHTDKPEADPSQPAPRAVPVPPQNGNREQAPDRSDENNIKRSWRLVTFFTTLWNARPSDGGQAIFNALLVVIGFLQWLVYRRQADLMKGQLVATETAASAANTANVVSREILAATRRPWVSVMVSIGSRGLYYDENGANLHLTFTLSNAGSTPAAYVQIEGGPSFDVLTNDIMKELDKVCNQARTACIDARMIGTNIFPGETQYSEMIYTFANCDFIRERQASHMQGVVNPYVFGCVDYVPAFDRTQRFQSRFVFRLLRVGLNGTRGAVNLKDGNIPSGDLILERWVEAGSFYAN